MLCLGKKVEEAFGEEVQGKKEVAHNGEIVPEALMEALA